MVFRTIRAMAGVGALAACALAAFGGVTRAQGPPGGLPMAGGPMGMFPLTAVNIPAPVLKKAVGLTTDQEAKVASIQRNLIQKVRALLPGPPGGFGPPPDADGPPPADGSGPPPPDPAKMKALMDKLKTLGESANQQIAAALTAAQKTRLTRVVKDANNLRQVGIPFEVLGSIKLTADQSKKIDEIAATALKDTQSAMAKAQDENERAGVWQAMGAIIQKSRAAAMAGLTDDQRTAVKKAIASMPRPGGPGFGPPPEGNEPPPAPPDDNGQ